MPRPSILKSVLIAASLVIILAAMHFAASRVAPILFAFFIAALLTPIFRRLKRKMRAPLALLLSIGVLALVALFLLLLVGSSVNTLISNLAEYQDALGQRQDELEAMAGDIGQSSPVQLVLSALEPETLVGVIKFFLNTLYSLLKNSILILFVTIFALAEGPVFKARMIKTFGAEHYLPRKTITSLDLTISYFSLRAIVNLIVAVCTALMLWWFGIESAALWGVLIFFLSFIPYIGAFVSTIPPVILAFAQGGLELALIIIIFTILINSLTENVVSPLVMGKGLSISPTVVFLSFVFWMFILGGLGAFIAMPITLTLVLFMGEFEETHDLAALMVIIPDQPESLATEQK